MRKEHPLDAIIAVDDSATLLAAQAGAALGLAHNPPEAAEAARDKGIMRRPMAAAGVPVRSSGASRWLATPMRSRDRSSTPASSSRCASLAAVA